MIRNDCIMSELEFKLRTFSSSLTIILDIIIVVFPRIFSTVPKKFCFKCTKKVFEEKSPDVENPVCGCSFRDREFVINIRLLDTCVVEKIRNDGFLCVSKQTTLFENKGKQSQHCITSKLLLKVFFVHRFEY